MNKTFYIADLHLQHSNVIKFDKRPFNNVEEMDDAIILRFTWMMGLSYPGIKASPSIIKNVMNALISHTPTLFTVHEKRGMTYAKHLATQFDKITELEPGIYHVASKNTMTTYESAKFVAKALGASDEHKVCKTYRRIDKSRKRCCPHTQSHRVQIVHLLIFPCQFQHKIPHQINAAQEFRNPQQHIQDGHNSR